MKASRIFSSHLFVLVAAFLILGWRVLVVPLNQLWGDLVTIVAVYALTRSLVPECQVPLLTVATVTLLLGIYVYGQFPYTLMILGFGR